jgi:hypothetical protein
VKNIGFITLIYGIVFDSRFLEVISSPQVLFYDNPNMIYLNPVFFIKGNHYLLESLFMLKYKSKLKKYLLLLEETIEDPRFPVNDNIALVFPLFI